MLLSLHSFSSMRCILSGPCGLEALSLSIAFEVLSDVIMTVVTSCVKFLSLKVGIGSATYF